MSDVAQLSRRGKSLLAVFDAVEMAGDISAPSAPGDAPDQAAAPSSSLSRVGSRAATAEPGAMPSPPLSRMNTMRSTRARSVSEGEQEADPAGGPVPEPDVPASVSAPGLRVLWADGAPPANKTV